MKKGNILLISAVAVLVVGGVLFFALRPKRKDTDEEKKDTSEDEVKTPVTPKSEDLSKLPKGGGGLFGGSLIGLSKSLSGFEEYEVVAMKLNVRDEPSTKGKILKTIAKGDKITAKEFGNKDWLMLAPGGQFVSKNFVKKTKQEGLAAVK